MLKFLLIFSWVAWKYVKTIILCHLLPWKEVRGLRMTGNRGKTSKRGINNKTSNFHGSIVFWVVVWVANTTTQYWRKPHRLKLICCAVFFGALQQCLSTSATLRGMILNSQNSPISGWGFLGNEFYISKLQCYWIVCLCVASHYCLACYSQDYHPFSPLSVELSFFYGV